MKYFTIAFALLLVCIVIVANLQISNPLFDLLKSIPMGDKIMHFTLMGLMAFFANLALNAKTIKVGAINLLKGSLIVALIVTIEEGSQYFISTRTCDWVDLLCDYAGISILGSLALFFKKQNPSRVSNS